MDERDNGQAVAHEVSVREHDALGLARGAAGVDERSEILGPDGDSEVVQESVGLGGLLAEEGFAREAEAVPGAICIWVIRLRKIVGIDRFQRREARQDGGNLRAECFRGDEDEFRARIIEDLVELVGSERRINRDVDRTETEDREVDEVPDGPIGFGGVGDAVAGTDTHRVQTGGEGADGFGDFLRGVFAPFAADLAREGVRLRIMGQLMRKEVEDARGGRNGRGDGREHSLSRGRVGSSFRAEVFLGERREWPGDGKSEFHAT